MDFEIDLRFCHPTFPCKHWVTFFREKEKSGLMAGDNIVKLCLQYNVPVPNHFRDLVTYF